MHIQMIYNDHTYNLPKYTLEVMDAMNEISNATDALVKAELMYKFVLNALGEETAKDIIGEDLKDADLIELLNIYSSIDHAYAVSMHENDTNGEPDELFEIIDRLGGMDNVITLLNTVNANK